MTYYFKPDTYTRSLVAIPDMTLQSAFISSGDITNRALLSNIPQSEGTNAILERGYASGVEWMECQDSLWTSISPFLQGIELTSATTIMPTGYLRDDKRPRMATFTDKHNLLAITDSLGWNGGTTGTGGSDSYVTKAFKKWAGETTTPWGGEPTAEYVTYNKALLHNGNGGSFFGGINNSDFSNDHEMMRPVKYSTLSLDNLDAIFIALGTNDLSNDGAANGAAVWSRAQVFVGGLVASFPNTKIIMATIPRRSEVSSTNTKINEYNTLLKAGYVGLGVDVICDIEQAHANFSTSTGDSTGAAYLDGTHFSDIGIEAASSELLRSINYLYA